MDKRWQRGPGPPNPLLDAIPPLTTLLALIVCGALRCQFPCDNDRDRKEDDCPHDCAPDMVLRPDQFSLKHWRNATILVLKRQKLLTNALDALYLPYVDRMLLVR